MEKSIWDNFTHQYSLSKTIRFALIPQGNTREMMEKNNIIETDKEIDRLYHEKMKGMYDEMHREFVAEALKKITLPQINEYTFLHNRKRNISEALSEDYTKMFNKALPKVKKPMARKNETAEIALIRYQVDNRLEELAKEMRELIVANFAIQGNAWHEDSRFSNIKFGTADKGIKILFGVKSLSILKVLFPDEVESIEKFDKFFTYFLGFNKNRENLYSVGGESTAIATRLIDNNLPKFLDDVLLFNKQYKDTLELEELEKAYKVFVKEVFQPNYYSNLLTQKGIELFNNIIGGKDNEEKGVEQVHGINAKINELKQKENLKKCKPLRKLDKLILSEKTKQYGILTITDDDKAVSEIIGWGERIVEDCTKLHKETIVSLFTEQSLDLSKVYINKVSINTIIGRWFLLPSEVREAIGKIYYEKKVYNKKVADHEKKNSQIELPDNITLKQFILAIESIPVDSIKEVFKKEYINGQSDSVTSIIYSILLNDHKKIIDGADGESSISELLEEMKTVLNGKTSVAQSDGKAVVAIKAFYDRALRYNQLLRFFIPRQKRNALPLVFDVALYAPIENLLSEVKIYDWYDAVRNYMTRKPYSEQKLKLNFHSAELLRGWDMTVEHKKRSVVFKDNESYYLGIIDRSSTSIFKEKSIVIDPSDSSFTKMVYKYMRDVSLSIPGTTTQTKVVIKHFLNNDKDYILEKGASIGKFTKPLVISKRIFELNNRIYKKTDLTVSILRQEIDKTNANKNYIKAFQKDYKSLGGSVKIYNSALSDWIDFCKEYVECYPSCSFFDYSSLKKTDEYNSIDKFYLDLDSAGYSVNFIPISREYVGNLVNHGKLYLFKIHTKDWNLKDNEKKIGNKNLQTLYFEDLFSSANKDHGYIFKLDGQAEIFFRPKTEKKKLDIKNDSKGNSVVDHKRYVKDTFLLHLPITINRVKKKAKTKNAPVKFNKKINEYIASNKKSDFNVIGIDRGEKHLLYVSVINSDGKIIDGKSLNIIKETNYHELLVKRENERQNARKAWESIGKIKDLKSGYLSLAVKEIVDLAIKHNAVIMLEDLNMGFKRGRQKFERSVYQQFEKRLIDKLNFLVFKDVKEGEVGSPLNAYQLTAPFVSFDKMGKQTGILFYIPAAYTSKIDPITGFQTNIFYSYNNLETAQKFWKEGFKEIKWNDKEQYFEFSYSLKDQKALEDGKRSLPEKTDWTICSKGTRYRWIPNGSVWSKLDGASLMERAEEGEDTQSKRGACHKFELNEVITAILDREGIEWRSGNNIKQAFSEVVTRKSHVELIFALKLVMQVRNSWTDKKGVSHDAIYSPVAPFFSTDDVNEDGVWSYDGTKQPRDGDENGSYHIAKKGLMAIDRINELPENPKLFISNVEWNDFTQLN